jgi:hypothetical protein
MPATRTKPKAATSRAAPPAAETAISPEVQTLDEAAAYLRVSAEDVLRMNREQALPGASLASNGGS